MIEINKYFEAGTRVIINTFEGEFHGVVVSWRDTFLSEFNPPAPPSNKTPIEQPLDLNPVNLDRLVTIYTVLVDGEQEPREITNFIRAE